jgi:hypothetical protein
MRDRCVARAAVLENQNVNFLGVVAKFCGHSLDGADFAFFRREGAVHDIEGSPWGS